MGDILSAENIIKQYAGHRALDDVSLSVPEGSIYGLLGPNGAGKTTLLRIINRITAPDSGTLKFDERPMTADDVCRIGYLPEERGLYKKMKVGEQALYLARLKGLDKTEARTQLEMWFRKFNIMGWWDRKVDELSKGMAQKVQFIVTVIHRPRLLIFDEPFSGFDPINAQLLRDEILNLRDEGATVIFSTHNMASVEEICDHITLINKSRNILTGPVDEIRRSWGTGSYRVDFAGDPVQLAGAVDGLCSSEPAAPEASADADRLNSLVLTPLTRDIRVRELVGRINETVEIHGFREMIPSMNDIFIRAVEASDDPTEK
ncbi:ABC transporter ATP-binding protein [uncultured Rikenella sp.]|uniref:ABC transporter ATP-binding protein n=1 Tax=uncultured Rikenella sp. TaxID=368003 RepID=UPI00261D1369|nr:ABC transporter ATP-binding protein [uncultured Rikenella sp.]